jgi:hypothetical protein
MDVAYGIRSSWPILLAACLHLLWGGRALADPMYNAIDLGTGSSTFGVDPTGNGTVTGSNGLTYTFNPVQNHLPAQWEDTSQGVPIVAPPPTQDPMTYGNPKFAFSNSILHFMNNQGLAAGIDAYGVSGHLANSQAFITQLRSDGSWGPATPLWSGLNDFAPGPSGIGIIGISPSGLVLGWGVQNPSAPWSTALYLYDSRTHTLTSMTSLVDSMNWTNAPFPAGQLTNWSLANMLSQLDNQGRILVQATEGLSGPVHDLLLIPQGLAPDPVPAPEPATWAVFAILLGGWMARRRLRSRTRIGSRSGSQPDSGRVPL